MMSLSAMKQIRALCKEERYNEAIQQIDAVQAQGYEDASLLTLKALCIQMGEGSPHTLEDAKAALEKAAALEEGSAEAQLELGWYLYNVDDDAEAAQPAFEKAIELLQAQLTSSVIGAVKAIREARSDDAARKFLRDLGEKLLDQEALKEALEE